MRYCGNCGAVQKKENVVCPACGVKLCNKSRIERMRRMKNRAVGARNESWRFDKEDAAASRMAALLAYIPLGVVASYMLARESPFARYHRTQGRRLLLPEGILLVLGLLLTRLARCLLPFLVWPLRFLFMLPGAGLLALLLAGCVAAGKGKAIALPFIGEKRE